MQYNTCRITGQTRPEKLLPYAEARENLAEQILAGKFSGDFAQCVLGKA
jgi:hypothetical protein